MKNIIIFGITDLAQLVFNYLQEQSGINVSAFTVNRDFIPKGNTFLGIDVVAFEEIERFYSNSNYAMIVCVGYNNMNQHREKIYNEVRQKGYKIESFIHPDAKVYSRKTGEGNIVLPGVIIDPFTSIGDGNIFFTGSLLSHHSNVGNYNFFAVKSCITGHVNIQNNCFFGAHSTVKNGIDIKSYCLVGANAFVDRNIEDYSVIVPQKSSILTDKKSIDINLK